MEQAVQSPYAGRLNQNYLKSGTKDRARDHSLVKMRVHNRSTLALGLPGANLIDIGTHEITVYDDDVDAVRDMVEDPQKIAQAEQQYAIDLAEEVGKHLETPWQRSAEELLAIIRSGSDPAVTEMHQRVLRTTGQSPQSAFQRLFKRSMKPLSMAELIPNSEHPEHQRAQTHKEVEKAAQAHAEALRVVAREIVAELRGAASAAPSEDKIAALVDARVKELLGEKVAKR